MLVFVVNSYYNFWHEFANLNPCMVIRWSWEILLSQRLEAYKNFLVWPLRFHSSSHLKICHQGLRALSQHLPALHICPPLGYDTTSTTTFAKTKISVVHQIYSLWDSYGGSVRTCHGLKRWNIKGIGPPITKIEVNIWSCTIVLELVLIKVMLLIQSLFSHLPIHISFPTNIYIYTKCVNDA